MEKPTTIKAAESLLWQLIKDEQQFIYRKIEAPLSEYRNKLIQEHKLELNSYAEKKKEVKNLLKFLKETKSRKKNIHPNITDWLIRVYSSGIDWGYGGIKVTYVHPENLFIIVTNKGSTAGTGTAMGTGGYYYSPSSHWVVFPQFEIHRAKMPCGSSRNEFFSQDGRLTNAIKEKMITQAEEYVNKHNVYPFDPENLFKQKAT